MPGAVSDAGFNLLSIHGITFNRNNKFYTGSFMGQSIHEIDIQSGESAVFIDPLKGMADDLESSPETL